MHLIISKVDGFIKEKIKNKYLVFDSTNEKKEVLKKNTHNFEMELNIRLGQYIVVKQVNMEKIS